MKKSCQEHRKPLWQKKTVLEIFHQSLKVVYITCPHVLLNKADRRGTLYSNMVVKKIVSDLKCTEKIALIIFVSPNEQGTLCQEYVQV